MDDRICGHCRFHQKGSAGIRAGFEWFEYGGDSARPNGRCQCEASKWHRVVMGHIGSCEQFEARLSETAIP